MKIGIDPGHGGKDPGAVGPTRLYEKDVTLGISRELSQLLQTAGLETFLTRTDDRTVELSTRTALLNNQKCDLAISVHCNSVTDPKPNYFAVFVHGLGGEAEKLAHRVIEKVTAATGWSWGADDDGIREKNLHITRETKMPAILVECGFISNPEQEKQLRQAEFQKKLARAIADGVLAYLGKKKGGSDVVEKPAQWKLDIMKQAEQAGLIEKGKHQPDEAATKWFVLAVCLNLLKGGK